MEIQQLKYFMAVVEAAHFGRAADAQNVSQPALSAGIRKLEDDLGIRLFQRGRHGAQLTAEGRGLLPHARAILAGVTAARIQAAGRKGLSGLRIGIMRTIPPERISAWLVRLRRELPELQFEVIEGSPGALRQRLTSGHIDMALTMLNERGVGPHVPLFRSRYSVLMPAKHPWARRMGMSVTELTGEPFILRRQCEFHGAALMYFNELEVRPGILCRTGDDARAMELVSCGLGVTAGPDRLRRQGVVAVRLDDVDLSYQYGLELAPGVRSAAVEQVIQTAQEVDWYGAADFDPAAHI